MSRPRSLEQVRISFESKYEVDPTSGCWQWRAAQNPGGYGAFKSIDRVVRAHRFSYELHRGPIPEGFVLDHLCRRPECVNPYHLEPVTVRTNNLRGIGFAATRSRLTHCKRGHPFDDANTYVKANGCRNCLTCRRATSAAYDAKRRAK